MSGPIVIDTLARLDGMTFWHGGPRIAGDRLLPATSRQTCRSGEPDGWVYLSRTRSLALMYATTCNGWLYEVQPIGPVTLDPGSMLSWGSFRCRQALILRRFRPSAAETQQARRAMRRVAV